MKRMSFLPMGAVVLLLAFTACSEELNEVPSGTLKQIVMTAADFETEDGSRTNFQITSAGAEFSWAANDTVGIFPNEGAQAYFPMTSGAGTKSANFTGGGWALKDASTYAAYYPFIGDFYLNKNAIPVDFTGQVQTGNASTAHLGAYDYMAAIPATPQNGNVSFAFKHLGALVQLKLTVPQATTLNSVTLTTENNAFAVNGTVDVMASAPGITSVTSANEVTLELKELATTEANQVVTLYMMLPPVDLSAKTLKAVVKTSNGTEEVTLGSKNFQAGKAYALSGSLKDPNGGAVVGNGTYKDGVVSIATAGTLKKLLGDDYLNITSLKVVGPINGDDMYYLLKMLGGDNFSEPDWGKLTTIDLLDASIVEGGEWYYKDSSSEPHYTSNNVIGNYMFHGCANLKNIILPSNANSIGDNSFKNCYSLTSVTIGNNVNSIGKSAFMYCSSLASITIGDSVNSIGEGAFNHCYSLTSAIIGNGVTSIGYNAFNLCRSLLSVTIGNGVIEIEEDAFKDCYSLASVYISDLSAWFGINFHGEKSNPLHRFAKLYLNNNELIELVIPNDITSIKDYALYGCPSITRVSIGDNVSTIGNSAFNLCRSLLSVTIGDGVTSIGKDAFNGCDAMKSVDIGDSVTSIGGWAFSYCDALTSINIPDGVTLIGESAFYECESLTSVIIGDGVISIGEWTFGKCENLISVTIGENVKNIGQYAFESSPITEFYSHATTPPSLPKDYQNSCFNSITDGATLYVPTRCIIDYKYSYWGRFFKFIIEKDFK